METETIEQLKLKLEVLQKRNLELEARANGRAPAGATMQEIRRWRKWIEDRGISLKEAQEALKIAEETTGWWRGFMGLLHLEIERVSDEAFDPNLGDELRHFRAGRAAALKDFQAVVIDTRAAGRVEEKAKG